MPLIVELPQSEKQALSDYLRDHSVQCTELAELDFTEADAIVSILIPTALTAAQIVAQYIIHRHIPPHSKHPRISAYLDGSELDLTKRDATSLTDMVVSNKGPQGLSPD